MNNLLQILQKMRKRTWVTTIIVTATFFLLLFIVVPKPDLYAQYNFSSAVYDRNGKLLKLTLSVDDKYRLFVPFTEIPEEAKRALLLYEDRGFYFHFGINPLSVIKAAIQTATGRRKRGASTITMQVARIIYHIDSATVIGKIKQMLRALQIEMFYSKKEILEAYFNVAPYGGNIEGIGAAAQIYYNAKTKNLNLPQILALTVIPQNPEKRSLLSVRGRQKNIIAATMLQKIWKQKYQHKENEYLNLPLASSVYLPNEAPHFVRRVLENRQGQIVSTLDLNLQHQAEEILHQYVTAHHKKGVYNASALIINAQTMDTLTYIGSNNFYDNNILGQVDGIKALRSPGSALKPFIYALALEKGIIHPKTMLKDVPKNYGLYTPENFDKSFYGLVNATDALIFSRNIPAVELLLRVGEQNMYNLLKNCGVAKLKSPEFYGLAMALGGIEVSAENLGAMYAMLYNYGKFENIHFVKQEKLPVSQQISPESAFMTMDMLSQNQPVDELKNGFSGTKLRYPVAWKTGTSYGFKDAWSVGIVGPYVVVIWVGNFDGTPNNAFVGREIAAPLFFRFIRLLGKQNKFLPSLQPRTDLNLAVVEVCQNTGDIANSDCTDTVPTYFIPGISTIKLSNVTRRIPIDIVSGLRACKHTPPTTEMRAYNFWPSDVLQAYAHAGITLKRPPEFKENCTKFDRTYSGTPPQIIYPADKSRYLVRSQKLSQEKIALKAVADADAKYIYWFINNKLVAKVNVNNIAEITPPVGHSEIKAVDDIGRETTVNIQVDLLN